MPHGETSSKWGDVLKAVWAVPCVQAVVNSAFDDAKQAFSEASTAERIPVPGVEGLAFSLYRRGMGLKIPIPRVRGLTIEGHFELGRSRWQDVEYDVRIEYELMGW